MMAAEFTPPARMPCLFVNHGGGPMPLLGSDPTSVRATMIMHRHCSSQLTPTLHWSRLHGCRLLKSISEGLHLPLFWSSQPTGKPTL